MQTNMTSRDGKAIIGLQGRFDFNAHREFRDVVDQAMKDPAHEIHVDLGSVDYLDSSALGMLLMLRDKAKGGGQGGRAGKCTRLGKASDQHRQFRQTVCVGVRCR